jgi:predicted esterase
MILTLFLSAVVVTLGAAQGLPKEIDALVDSRFSDDHGIRDRLVEQVTSGGLTLDALEAAIRGRRAEYPPLAVSLGQLVKDQKLVCDHFDYDTVYHLYVPKSYDPKRPTSLVVVGHGGNGAMSMERATRVARDYLSYWVDAAEKHGMIAVAPATTRGWVAYGNSIMFSLISKLQREFCIDPDRIYVTGHSMGGHLSYRSGIMFADRFGAIAPKSGGYDYVANEQIVSMFNVPGYATFGKNEPYDINTFNRTMADWMKGRGYDWKMVEKNGGHEIYKDEIDRQFAFFLERPRNLYRDRLEIRCGGSLRQDRKQEMNPAWDRDHTWNEKRPILLETTHWARVSPNPDPKLVQRASIRRTGRSSVDIRCENLWKLRLYLHPKQFDLEKPLKVVVNGAYREVVPTVSAQMMLDLVREFDDRGRVFRAYVDLTDLPSAPVPLPEVL